MILLQLLVVGTRTVVETIHPRVTYQLNQVLVAMLVLGQHYQVVSTQVFLAFFQHHVASACHIHLATKNGLKRFKSVFFTLFVHTVAYVVKFLNAEHVAVVGNGHTLHAIADSFVYKLFDTRLSVEYRVICMYVQMYEIFHRFLLKCLFLWSKVTPIFRDYQKKNVKSL